MKKILWFLIMLPLISANEIGFDEQFNLAQDREKVLEKLLPGTNEYYYYHCLYYQHQQKYDDVEKLLKEWVKQHGTVSLSKEIENRHVLLTYKKNPEATFNYVINELGLSFNHQRKQKEQEKTYPDTLDAKLIDGTVLKEKTLAENNSLNRFEDSALEFLIHEQLSGEERRELLKRLKTPDYPRLAILVIEDLKYRYSGGFGSLDIHNKLLLAQLDECLNRMPQLIKNTNFTNIYLQKLRPSEDSNWWQNKNVREVYLNRLWDFVQLLPTSQNSLKTHVLYHLLDFHQKQNTYPKELLLEYLKLPRSVSYINSEYLRGSRDIAYLNSNYKNYTGLESINNDEALVRNYLQHFFMTAENYDAFMPYIESDYLKELFATTKILYGIGEMQNWYALLSPEKYQTLKERVELEFLPYNKDHFATKEHVSLQMIIKNVKTLIIKTYYINTENYYRSNNSEISSAIDLDGLVANHETIVNYNQAPQNRHVETFDFHHIQNAGIYVIEFIGNGQSSRALIRKGNLICLERVGAGGHVFTIHDEQNQLLKDAQILYGGREYNADENGEIAIPFTNQPGKKQMILLHNNFASLHSFNHQEESYRFEVDFFLDRESVIKRQNAQVIIRPKLYISGESTTVELLKEVQLQVRSTNREGTKSTQEINTFPLFDTKEATYTFKVPEDLAEIAFTLTAKVRNISKGTDENLSGSYSLSVNGIDKTDRINDVYLRHTSKGYDIEVLGKTGEPYANQVVTVALKHHDYKNTIHTTLQTNKNGRIHLGLLHDIDSVEVQSLGKSSRWSLSTASRSYPGTINSNTESPMYVPILTKSQKTSEVCSLLEVRGNTFVKEWNANAEVKNGFIKIANLPAGDYVLTLKEVNHQIKIRLTEGKKQGAYVFGNRYLEIQNPRPLQISNIKVSKKDKNLQLKLTNSDSATRVHVIATHFVPEVSIDEQITSIDGSTPNSIIPSFFEAIYLSGRNIGDEYRYILERKYNKKYPGNMLTRPSLLLNPWDLRKTDTSTQIAETGSDWGAAESPFGGRKYSSKEYKTSRNGYKKSSSKETINLDFLRNSSLVFTNLKPNKKGIVKIELKGLSPRQQIHILAVNNSDVVYREIALPKSKNRQYQDLRLDSPLSEKQHFSEQKNITAVREGKIFNIADITTSQIEVYDSLAKIASIFSTINNNSTLQEFNFILRWPQLTMAEKYQMYSKYACHELNFFIYKKDLDFFNQIVKPYLKNKKDKTFMDEWFLEENLIKYTNAWKYSRLNVVERILLSQRLGGEQLESIQNQIKDTQDLQPFNVDVFNSLFNTGIQSSSLSTEDPLALDKNKAFLDKSKDREYLPAEDMDELDGDFDDSYGDSAESEESADFYYEEKREKERNLKHREKQKQYYRNADQTKEWVENNYYRLPIEEQIAKLVNVNSFWKDYAVHNNKEPFLSTNFIEATSNFTEMMFALSVLDLPFDAAKHNVQYTQEKMTFSSGSSVIIFHQELRETTGKNDSPILINQSFFAADDRYSYKNNERFDKFVSEEFQSKRVYGCQVVVTNPTSAKRKINILLQIPNGAMPLKSGFYTKSFYHELQPYSTKTMEYFFYFPIAGAFTHYPVQVAQNGELIASAQPFSFKVVDTLSKQDTTSWEYISQYGTTEEVFAYLRNQNLYRVDLTMIAFRMKDSAFFKRALGILDAKHMYNHTLWSYALLHNDVVAANTYLKHSSYTQKCGSYLVSDLLNIDPVEHHTYQHKEYWPLINARTYQLGKKRQILNQQFFAHYEDFQRYMRYRPQLSDDDLNVFAIYLLLQDRVEEAIQMTKRINRKNLHTQIQYDYLQAYLHFYLEESEKAKEIASKYKSYPVSRWRLLFEEVLAQVEEISGKDASATNPEDLQQKQTDLAKTEPGFDFVIEKGQIVLTHQQIDNCRINYYPMDIELLFSRNPFVQQVSGQFAIIQPNDSTVLKLDSTQNKTTIAISSKYTEQNAMVEIVGAGKAKSQAYYPHMMNLRTIENYGQVKVTHIETGKPLSKVYVKVYARYKNNTVQFYKDGYTDLRGRFDYSSLNTDELNNVERFSILILSEEYGAIVKEVNPPKM